MSLFPMFETPEPAKLAPQAARLAPMLAKLAGREVYFGTSSWKYEGWLGSIYTRERYETRGKLSHKKFEADCLTEYAETFPVVCGDFSFYQFPTDEFWRKLFEGTPSKLTFGFKVPEELTVARWPTHARYGPRAGQPNDGFLDPLLFKTHYANPLFPYRERVATLIFEFGTFAKSTFATVDDFLAKLDPFLGALPKGFRYSVEIRNPEYLTPRYFHRLATHNVAHVYNAWTRMPELTDQVAIEDTVTADFTVVRALLQRGRNYEQAVKSFEPYEQIQEPSESVREGLRQIAEQAMYCQKPAYLFVNNRLEGHAPTTIEAVVSRLAALPGLGG